jgi:hypothetical protein
VFLVSGYKVPTCLTYVLQLTFSAFHSTHFAFIVFVCIQFSKLEVFLYCISGFVCYSYISGFEYSNSDSCFFPYVCKFDQLLFLLSAVFLFLFISSLVLIFNYICGEQLLFCSIVLLC